MMSNDTHYDIIKKVSNEGWNFNQIFVRELIHPRNEYVEKSALAYAFGAEVEETGKHFCPYCDEYLTDGVCNGFEDKVKEVLRREVIEPYMERHCPKCESKMEDYEMTRVIDDFEVGVVSDKSKPQKIEYEEKTRYKPCGCLHEIGEEEILWDLNKDKVRQEVGILNYNGPIFQ